MKNLILFFSLTFIPLQSFAVIYGLDNRKDISQVFHLKKYAQAVAINTGKDWLVDKGNSFAVFENELFGVSICKSERFVKQTTFGHCTAFLVGPQTLVTAGHCVAANEVVENNKEYCESMRWVFDYNDKGVSDVFKIPKSNVYGCEEIVYAANTEITKDDPEGLDFAVVKLDRPVVGITPLKVAKSLARGEKVYTMGHPMGLPLKYSGASSVIEVIDNGRVGVVNLDTQSGNSGGPVFNIRNEVVGILVSGHDVDTYEKPGESCERLNKCNSLGQSCFEDASTQFSNNFTTSSVFAPHIEPLSVIPMS